MPYKIKGKQLLHFKHGSWTVKQTASTHDKAVKAMHLLQGIEHGWVPKKRKTK
jgi:Zn/Cd-binding protein ZinT